ncbi:helix-turn-helix domain-containing protein [Acinetobacter baumannii]|uniref:helix-turn-helix domain-containing protein n=1 Tax=Acinetobacter baumannii TaxID=470 RepID=UPI000708440F|nr:helix-turn-helix domain-containing protein [Acinetobacter baumannii]EHU2111557.1 XRE family transcriptional regulator [Acinetobacter baumannii]EKV1657782.1 XRE family transcriptional regulator [Acinetobacter baumannii]EKV1846850.1 XRE family transcriptional regulator [Acinetobacter baumannii]EKV1976926.1 XRE family transcriptional regulator [Acinetobacter baumannii]EKV3534404.1 XRE family transcriptional regulator [Acinetobacter baumannii]
MNNKKVMCKAISNFSAIEVKKIQWASALNALMLHSGKSRSEMAEACNISKGRVTRILSGDSNLTIESICSFANALGYDVDIAFYNSSMTKPYQPWNSGQIEFATFKKVKKILFEERVLTASTPNLNTKVREIAVGSNSHTTWFSATKAQSIEIKEFTFE